MFPQLSITTKVFHWFACPNRVASTIVLKRITVNTEIEFPKTSRCLVSRGTQSERAVPCSLEMGELLNELNGRNFTIFPVLVWGCLALRWVQLSPVCNAMKIQRFKAFPVALAPSFHRPHWSRSLKCVPALCWSCANDKEQALKHTDSICRFWGQLQCL